METHGLQITDHFLGLTKYFTLGQFYSDTHP